MFFCIDSLRFDFIVAHFWFECFSMDSKINLRMLKINRSLKIVKIHLFIHESGWECIWCYCLILLFSFLLKHTQRARPEMNGSGVRYSEGKDPLTCTAPAALHTVFPGDGVHVCARRPSRLTRPATRVSVSDRTTDLHPAACVVALYRSR